MDGIEMIGKVEAINGHDILKRVYSSGGGITYIIYNGRWEYGAEDNGTVYCSKQGTGPQEPQRPNCWQPKFSTTARAEKGRYD